MHTESKELYDFIADWIAPDFFFSKKDQWGRFGILGVLGDMIVSSTEGNLLEIGVGESSLYLGAIAKKYDRRIFHCDIAAGKITNPMTVPGFFPETCSYVLEKSLTEDKKTLTDLESFRNCLLFCGSSDNLFEYIGFPELALSFIDGDHNYKQVKHDFNHCLQRTVSNGFIFIHDTYPPDEEMTSEHRCGTVYKLRQELENQKEYLDVFTFPKCVAVGVGLTIVRKKPSNREYYQK